MLLNYAIWAFNYVKIIKTIALLSVFTCAGCTHDWTVGQEYIGKPYVNNPLGEGVAPDTDPLIRYDAFDCATFVETVLADGDIDKLNKIRYSGKNPDITNRNHFVETDWLENNSDLIANVSAQYAPTSVRNVTIDKKKWFKTVHNIDTNFAPRNIKLEYIPYTNAQNIRVTKPMIVLFIIDSPKIRNKIGTDLAVRHMGFLLPNGMLRHASRRLGRVADEDFTKYIQQIMENQNNLGIILLEIKK